MKKLLSEKAAKNAACLMMVVCYFVMLFVIFGLVLSVIGRQTFILHTNGEIWNSAIIAEEYRDWTTRGLTTGTPGEIRIHATDEIDIIARISLSAVYAVAVIPGIISFWFLSRVFSNVYKGRIFTEQNALYILYFGLIRIAAAVFAPFLKLGIIGLANHFSDNMISIGIMHDFFVGLVPNIAFIIAAYIIRYGVNLQDEVDHTL